MTHVYLLINNLSGGGAEHVASDLSNHAPVNCALRLITLESGTQAYNLTQIPHSLDLHKHIYLPHSLYLFKEILVGIWRYVHLLRSEHPEVSFSMVEPSNLINIISSKLTGTKAIISIRGNPSSQYQSNITRIYSYIMLKIAFHFSIKIITNSHGIKDDLLKKYGVKDELVSVIYNPKDLIYISNMKDKPINNDFFVTKSPIIITIGRLESIKGQWHLIRVFAYIRKYKYIQCKLVICGTGPLQSYLESLAVDLGVREDVLFLGWCENPYKYLAHSSIFAFPSLSEAQPNALIEAMICGCPVVAADCDYGPREILENGKYGLLSKRLDGVQYTALDPLTPAEEDMLDKITYLFENEELLTHYSRLGLQRTKVFDKDQIINLYYQEIMSVCDSKPHKMKD